MYMANGTKSRSAPNLRNTGCMVFDILSNSLISFCCFTIIYLLIVKERPHQPPNSQSTPLLSLSQALQLQQGQEGKAVHPRTWSLPLPLRMLQKLCNRDWKNTSMPQTKQKKKETPVKLGEWDVLSRLAAF